MTDLPPEPDPRTAADDQEDATDEGVSAPTPAEGGDNEPGRDDGSPKADVAERAVTLAVVTGAHGIGGEARLKVFADDLSPHRSFNDGALTVRSLRAGGGGAIVRFAEVADRNAAEALRGTLLTVPRTALPPLDEGEYYHADLIGLAAVSTAGEPLGRVVEVANFGAGDVVEIERPGGKRFMVPMRVEAVPAWDGDTLTVDAAFADA